MTLLHMCKSNQVARILINHPEPYRTNKTPNGVTIFQKRHVKVSNWAEYDAGLRRRTSLRLWVTDEAMAAWWTTSRLTPGGRRCYWNLAIETGLMLRLAFHLPLRQTEGLMASVFALLEVSLNVPDHGTLSRWAMNLASISNGVRARWPYSVANGLPAPSRRLNDKPHGSGGGSLIFLRRGIAKI